MTDDQESAWWEAVENAGRWFTHLLLILLTWPLWLIGKLLPAAPKDDA